MRTGDGLDILKSEAQFKQKVVTLQVGDSLHINATADTLWVEGMVVIGANLFGRIRIGRDDGTHVFVENPDGDRLVRVLNLNLAPPDSVTALGMGAGTVYQGTDSGGGAVLRIKLH